MSSHPADPAALEAALLRAEAALDAGDGPAAAEAVLEGVRQCAALDAAGARLGPEALARLRALHARGLARATAERDRLAAAVEQTGRSRRAAQAYGGR